METVAAILAALAISLAAVAYFRTLVEIWKDREWTFLALFLSFPLAGLAWLLMAISKALSEGA